MRPILYRAYEADRQIQLWEFAVDQLHIIWDWTTSLSISASTRLGEFAVVPQLPTCFSPLHGGSNLLVQLHLERDCASVAKNSESQTAVNFIRGRGR